MSPYEATEPFLSIILAQLFEFRQDLNRYLTPKRTFVTTTTERSQKGPHDGYSHVGPSGNSFIINELRVEMRIIVIMLSIDRVLN
jgi:hypothetical protein